MRIGLLLIGNELLSGKIRDKNALYLASALKPKGALIAKTIIVEDHAESIHRSLTHLFDEVDFVITSGGLGPTVDDLTKEVVADFFKLKLEYSKETHAMVSENYRRRGRDYASVDHGYEYIPQGSTPLNNPAGMAPGIKIVHQEKTLCMLPGVPKEFSAIVEESILPTLPKDHETFHFTCRTKFTPESKLFELLEDQLEVFQSLGTLAFLPHPTHVDVGISFQGSMETNKIKTAQLKKLFLDSPIKDRIWHFGNESLEEVIIDKAKEKKITIALAESCTGGLNAHRLTNVSGSSSVFMGAVVSYSNEAKTSLLDVNADTLKNFGAVSEEVAMEMAEGARKKLTTDIALSTTGIAGPGGGSDKKPVGTLWIGVSTKEKTQAFHYQFYGDREELKERFSNTALFHLLNLIEIKKA